jgi:2-polyprenyl-3-methyl-5-hydroxy-6-metoxy-1,4-benzoquinol methylase
MTDDSHQHSQEKTEHGYEWKLQKEAEFWGVMARERCKGGIPMTMDFRRATRYRVRRAILGWGDYFQDPALEALTPFGRARIKFVENARKNPGESALDLCCGAGWLALELARSGKKVDAVDISLEEISIAKKYQSTLKEDIPGQINWTIADLNSFTAAQAKYDQVTAWDGLHHVQNIDHLCSAISDSLKPNGRFLLSERIWGGANSSLRSRIGRYLEQHLWTLVPTPAPMTYGRKFKELFSTWKVIFRTKILRQKHNSTPWQIQEEGFCSPFEDTSGSEIIAAVRKYFEIEKLESYGGFTEEVLRSLYLPRALRIPAVLFLGWLDHIVVKAGLLEGKITIIYARKKR